MNTRLIKFGIAGATAALVEYAVFLLLQYHHGYQWLLASQSISFTCGFVVSFALNRSWVYRSPGAMSGELLRYALLAAINLVASNAVLAVLATYLSFPAALAKFLVMGMVACWNYLIFSRLIFRTVESPG